MSIQLCYMQVMYYLAFSLFTSTQLFTFNLQRIQILALFLVGFPTYSAAFLFARREQLPDGLQRSSVTFEGNPMFYWAIIIGDYGVMIWLFVLLLLGCYAPRVSSYEFFKQDRKVRQKQREREANIVSVDAHGNPVTEADLIKVKMQFQSAPNFDSAEYNSDDSELMAMKKHENGDDSDHGDDDDADDDDIGGE